MKLKSTSGFLTFTMSANAAAEPQLCVQPNVPWPVFKNTLRVFALPIYGTLLGVVGRSPVQ